MNKYVVIDEKTYGDSWSETFDTLEEANRNAKYTWETLTKSERRNRKVYVMRSLREPDDILSNLEDCDGAFFSDGYCVIPCEVEDTAASLYDGGWRASDREELRADYHFDDETLDRVCECLAEIEKSILER